MLDRSQCRRFLCGREQRVRRAFVNELPWAASLIRKRFVEEGPWLHPSNFEGYFRYADAAWRGK